MLPKEPTACAAPAVDGAADASADAAPDTEPRPRRRRRRRLPERRPSPVVHIVPPAAEAAPPAQAAPDDGFVLDLPLPDAWRELQAALVGVRRLVHDAEHARRWGLGPAPRRRRAG